MPKHFTTKNLPESERPYEKFLTYGEESLSDAELLAIIMSFVIYKITTKDDVCNEKRKQKLERRSNTFVGAMMCVGGLSMIRRIKEM